MINPSELVQLIEQAESLLKIDKDLRMGQALYMSLYNKDKVLADKITGTEYDPFYSDKKILKFLLYITSNEQYVSKSNLKFPMYA